ncbi:MAG: 4-alpha-glucanotransferase, partial [Ruminococcus flavefaciens]|nr:4-alpha-glucanotransferase [Ruminococcus flavefaciens]
KKELFLLDGEGYPEVQAGVPPDAFSDVGQLWGNPVYNWAKMREGGYSWWHRRIEEGLKLYDVLRIDHFIGFIRYFCIPADSADARTGEWCAGPGAELFKGFENRRIIAEDLGVVTDEVRAAIEKIGYPGMKILQHAFDGAEDNEHRPSNYRENCAAYTGTHDNETLLTRLFKMTEQEYEKMLAVLKKECEALGFTPKCGTVKDACGEILRLLFKSKASVVIFPLQDALCSGSEARINMPSVVSPENWSYRFLESDFSEELSGRIRGLAEESGRAENI